MSTISGQQNGGLDRTTSNALPDRNRSGQLHNAAQNWIRSRDSYWPERQNDNDSRDHQLLPDHWHVVVPSRDIFFQGTLFPQTGSFVSQGREWEQLFVWRFENIMLSIILKLI